MGLANWTLLALMKDELWFRENKQPAQGHKQFDGQAKVKYASLKCQSLRYHCIIVPLVRIIYLKSTGSRNSPLIVF